MIRQLARVTGEVSGTLTCYFSACRVGALLQVSHIWCLALSHSALKPLVSGRAYRVAQCLKHCLFAADDPAERLERGVHHHRLACAQTELCQVGRKMRFG